MKRISKIIIVLTFPVWAIGFLCGLAAGIVWVAMDAGWDLADFLTEAILREK